MEEQSVNNQISQIPVNPVNKNKNYLILISIIAGVLIAFGSFYIVGFQSQKQSTSIPQPIVSSTQPSPTPDPTANWKMYKSEKYAFEFKYPDYWEVKEDSKFPFVQLQQIRSDKVESIPGGITIIEKNKPENYYPTYLKMYSSDSKCPTVAGEINLHDTTNVYCLTGKDLQVNDRIWKGAVECSATVFYALKEDPETCPHQFWINTKNFFYIVHFNFFEPIKENSGQQRFFDQILSTFKFIDQEDQVVCTQEAKLCPDGKTYVGRQGSNCEFTPCP